MKQLLLILTFIVISIVGFSQTYTMSNVPVTTCSGTFYDSGGSGSNYANNENFTKTFTPGTPGDMLEFVFTSFSTESNYDYLYIYDGPNTGSPLIGTYDGTTSPGTITATNGTGEITFQFTSDFSNVSSGWAATISCVAPPTTYAMSNAPVNTCSGIFADDGGLSSNYTSNDYTETFTPSTAGMALQFVFSTWTMGDAQDYLSIYNGPTTGSPLIGTYNNASGSPGTITASNATGELTFYWYSDNNGLGAGWAATISCVTPPPANDACASATSLPCGTTDLAGTTNNCIAETDPAGCASDYGVWYTFTGDGNLTNISSTATFDHEMVIFSGSCGSLTNITCTDAALSGGTESYSFLTSGGTTYYVYIAHYSTSSTTTGDFTISRTCTPPPANDECAGATSVTVNTDESCSVVTSSSITGATNSGISACAGTADDDVWFSFVATSTSHNFDISNITGSVSDMVLEIFSGNCGSLTSVACSDPESSQFGGFTIGNTYYVRVYTYTSITSQTVDFDLCIGTPPPPPSNDEPCGAISLNVNSGFCSFQTAVLGTSTTLSSGIPAPGCGSLGPDVWFTAVVPASGRLIIDMDDNGGPTDLDMAWYYSSTDDCSNIDNLIECDDYQSQNGAMAMICRSGVICTVPGDCDQNATLTPGMTVYVRVWEYGGNTYGPFDIGAYEPDPPGAASNCSSPTNIASLPYSDNTTTCCRGIDFDNTDACGSFYMDGEDYVYTYTPSVDENIDITLTGTLSYTGVFVTKKCPSAGGSTCIASNESFSGNPSICGVSLTSGTTYYIVVSTNPTPDCTPFNINISSSTTPTCNLNYTMSSISFAPDLNNGTNVSLPVDDRFTSSYIPIGFNFCFDGYQFTQALLSSNGYIIFDPISCASNLPSGNASPGGTSDWSISSAIPNTDNAPRNSIMFPWQDIYPSLGGTIKYQTLGTSPNRRFVVTYANIPYYDCTSLLFSGQVKLFETTNDIEIHITNQEVCSTWNGGAAILGLHNYNGTIAVTNGAHNYPSQWATTNEAWKFTCNCIGCVAPLPIEISDFSYTCSNHSNILHWTTLTEINNDYFTIERSNDAIDYNTIAKIEGAGNSNEPKTYNYQDNINTPAYYRLSQVDYDGTTTRYKIIYVNCDETVDINIFPNPSLSGNPITINGKYNQVIITDLLGKEIVSTIKENKIYGLAKGAYIIDIDGKKFKILVK